MQLYSEVPISDPNFDIQYKDHIFCLGSCFVSEIGHKLQSLKFNSMINPFGTQFHPIALENVFSRIYTRAFYTDNEIYQYKDLYFSWDHSYQFSKPKKDDTLKLVNDAVDEGNEFLSKTDVFIFTLGTAWAYELKEAQFLVSNCHKVPQKHFEKKLLSFTSMYKAVKNLVLMAKDVRPNAKIIFTISPVRHARDGYRENNLSKGLLHQVIHELLQEFSELNYFPSYEIVMDELRDYRYYADDLVHLNKLGVDYIWERFCAHYFTDTTRQQIKEVQKIQAALNHKAVNPHGVEHKKFLYDTLKKLNTIAVNLPEHSFDKELLELKNRIHAD